MTVNTIETVKAALGSLEAKLNPPPDPKMKAEHATYRGFSVEVTAAEKKVLAGQFVDLNDLRNRIDAASGAIYPGVDQRPMVPNPPLPVEPGTRFGSAGQPPRQASASPSPDRGTQYSSDGSSGQTPQAGQRATDQRGADQRAASAPYPTTTPAPTTTPMPGDRRGGAGERAQEQADRDRRANEHPTTTPAPKHK